MCHIKRLFILVNVIVLLIGCGPMHNKNTYKVDKSLASVPKWAKEAIWYQIFVERFRNGDPLNDPTPVDMAASYPGKLPANWEITPWGHDWYSHERYILILLTMHHHCTNMTLEIILISTETLAPILKATLH